LPSSPSFPPELFLDIFSHTDRSTLAALCRTSLAFLELATPFLYSTAHLDDLPQSSTARSQRVAELLPRLALNSVRTLHLTLPKHRLIFPATNLPQLDHLPQTSLPKLDHLYIHHSQPPSPHIDPPWSVLNDLLSHLNPLSITFSLPTACEPHSIHGWDLPGAYWSSWSACWTRLDQLVLRGGGLGDYEDALDDDGEEISRSPFLPGPEGGGLAGGSARLIYDLRTIVSPLKSWAQAMLWDGEFDLPFSLERTVLVKTSSGEMEVILDAQFEDLGTDENGMAYRDRVEISRESEEEGELMLAEMEWWRRRGIGWAREGSIEA
jgi:hypothetical protein